MDALPQFVWLMQPDGSLIYTNQRWRDYSHPLSQHAGEQKGFARQQRDDCQPIQDRQRMLPHADSPSEKEIWLQNLHPEDKERVLELQRQAFIRGEPYKFEYRLRDGHTGTYRWFFSQHVPLRNKAGQIVQWLGNCTDIDDQKQTEEALRESQERASALVNSNIIGINIIEGEQIVDANDTFLCMTSYTREDLRAGNMNWLHMTHPDYLARTQQAHQELAIQQAITYEKEYVCKDGSRLPVLVGGVLFQHHPHQAIGFVLDNSARRELEQRKDAFLGMVSHELKTPLASLKLQTQLLRKKLGKQDLPNMEVVCARIDAQLNAITRLVDELLDISHIQTGTLEYAQDTVDLDEMLEDVVDVVQGMHTTHTIVVQHAASPAIVDGDRDRLAQVF
ncbi:PAS domain-containing protein [Ktedonobacter racemifer]|uniref:PAS domain-containing protein n=1 Tax=Ktedonobacter racemifer TaxID=363277 RepID=UPI003083D3E8